LALNGAALGCGRKGGGGSRLIVPKRVANTGCWGLGCRQKVFMEVQQKVIF